MLFSEPKIPQSCSVIADRSSAMCFSALQRAENSSMYPKMTASADCTCFSALQRAENSSIGAAERSSPGRRRFQCSSASRKFLNSGTRSSAQSAQRVSVLFSEPKIPQFGTIERSNEAAIMFQCSSASRKFLNLSCAAAASASVACFSALQRAENSSIVFGDGDAVDVESFSALQRAENSSMVNVPAQH